MALISDYGLLGDCQGSALVSRDGSIDWWCPSRFDSPSVFGRILDGRAGFWSVRPAAAFDVRRRYTDGSLVIETEFTTDTGTLRLTDALTFGLGERGHGIGFASPHVLVRRLELLTGTVETLVELEPRFEYGLVTPQFTQTESGIEIAGGADRLTLHATRPLAVDSTRASGKYRLDAGDVVVFALHHRHSTDLPVQRVDGAALLEDTTTAWQSWSHLHQSYRGPYREQVERSALVLQGLTYQPTGAVVAAATTSLPEEVGGSWNWDYRFGWVRDGSWTMKALWVAACPDESQRFFEWIARSAGFAEDAHLQIMFGVGGEHDLTEHELGHLSGYADSTPVRVGNDAWDQTQLDVLGEVLDSAWQLRDQLGELSPTTSAFLRSVADRAASTWREQDTGIWEGREGKRHYLTSKLMCWVALDRAVKLAPRLGSDSRVDRWGEERDAIRTAILERGWNAEVGAFTGAFDSDHLDAGVLLMPLVGFLPADDDRFLSTLEVIERDLGNDELLQRWTGAGGEGAFLICSYWLASGFAQSGQVERARTIFEAVSAHANDLGLLSEEVDLKNRTLLGNFPQGLSHVGLINAAWTIAEATKAAHK
ncbi:MAG: glycoside hydrolase 15-related [Cryobacterium sp.]|nr:glycoside hydrolase 15-related [Cryobacterium sp.]